MALNYPSYQEYLAELLRQSGQVKVVAEKRRRSWLLFWGEKSLKGSGRALEPIIRKFPRGSRRKVDAEIRNHCCNLWHGDKCLLLDDGIEHRCTQLGADSLKCVWFRDAVLPGNLDLLAEIQGETCTPRRCEVCGLPFRALSNRAKYCSKCSKRRERERKAAWAQKTRKRVDV